MVFNRQALERELAAQLPPGYERVLVKPPWSGTLSACRACERIADERGEFNSWKVVLVRRTLHTKERVLFTFAIVCNECFELKSTADILAHRAFGV